MDAFKTTVSALLGLFSAIFLEYFLKFRPGLSEKYVLKADCQGASGKLHDENREDHQLIFNELKEIRSEMMKTQTMIMQELRR